VKGAGDIPFRRERFFGSDWRSAFRKAVADAGLGIRM